MHEHGFRENSGSGRSSCFDESAWWWTGDLYERPNDVAAMSIARNCDF
jgi:hypothetical protein